MSLIPAPSGSTGAHQIVPYDMDTPSAMRLTQRAPMRRWGQRTKSVWLKSQSKVMELDCGIRRCCIAQPVILPACAASVEPSLHQPQRYCGAAALGAPFYQRYGYFKMYGAAGKGAKTAYAHNFPAGSMPAPKTVYGNFVP